VNGTTSSAPEQTPAGNVIETIQSQQPNPAPLFELAPAALEVSPTDRLNEILSGLATQTRVTSNPQLRPSWDPRKVLVCVTDELRDSVARSLAENGYQVFVANDTRQAVDRMRESLMDVVLLDPRFDPVEQGPVYVTREVNILRPAQRRRLFFVLLSPSLRTLDNHTAFLNNANAIVNVNEIGDLPRLLDQRLRAFNELYKDFNQVNGVAAL
jgi:CheY-like chemotaxis protein